MAATPVALRPEASRERILDAAIQLFARHGVEGVGLALLAEHVGLHKSTLFHHFASKQELAQAALERAVLPLCAIVEPLARPDAAPELERLVEVGLALDDHFSREPAGARFLLRALVGPGAEFGGEPVLAQPAHPVSRIFATLGSWLERARRHGSVRRLRVHQALVNLLGLTLLYPAIAADLTRDVFRSEPGAPRLRRARREELAAHLRAAFGPAA